MHPAVVVILLIHSQIGYALETEVAIRNRRKSCNAVMNIEAVKTLIMGKKGSNLSAVIRKDMKTKVSYKAHKVSKITRLVIRGGIDYDNIGVVKEGREDGSLPAQNQGLPWGEWADDSGIHITHKGTDYARMYPASGIAFAPKVQYFLDGVEVEKSAIESICLASEFPKHDDEPLCFTIKAENILEIGGFTGE